ncbi:MAG: hypothetical protein HN347_01225 [Bacteroidetes bacterium]|jgi:hypothetical protein|nr:hypothetical protein [Bacteroidota bacterium]
MGIISDKIKKLPKKDLKKWVAAREKENRSQDWKDELEKLKKQFDVKGTGSKGKND